jgi:penicillin-binding protein
VGDAIKKVGIIPAGDTLEFNATNGEFYITAVDIAGNESAPSNTIQIGEPSESSTDKENAAKPPKEEKPKDSAEEDSDHHDGEEDHPPRTEND